MAISLVRSSLRFDVSSYMRHPLVQFSNSQMPQCHNKNISERTHVPRCLCFYPALSCLFPCTIFPQGALCTPLPSPCNQMVPTCVIGWCRLKSYHTLPLFSASFTICSCSITPHSSPCNPDSANLCRCLVPI